MIWWQIDHQLTIDVLFFLFVCLFEKKILKFQSLSHHSLLKTAKTLPENPQNWKLVIWSLNAVLIKRIAPSALLCLWMASVMTLLTLSANWRGRWYVVVANILLSTEVSGPRPLKSRNYLQSRKKFWYIIGSMACSAFLRVEQISLSSCYELLW